MSNCLDLKSFGELEKLFYGGEDSTSYFTKETRKCTKFCQIPVEMTKTNGTANFGYTWSVVIDKNYGDYLLTTWICIEIPEVSLKNDNSIGENGRIRWTENLLHNLIEECTLTLNDLVISKLDNFILDVISEYTISKNKYEKYMEQIGNIPELIYPTKKLNSKKLFLPLAMFFSKDTGNAIPLTSLPHTEIRINFKFRSWQSLLIMENCTSANTYIKVPSDDGLDLVQIPKIKSAQLFCNFAIVSPEERAKMGIKHKTIIIEQFHTSPRQMVINDDYVKMDLLFKQSVKTLFFGLRNTTYKNVWSNYTYGNSVFKGTYFLKQNNTKTLVSDAGIFYNNKERVPMLPIEFFQFINPWFHADSVPTKPGLFMYSYALHQNQSDPLGSTALCRIDNPYILLKLNDECKNAMKTGESFELNVVCESYTALSIKEGFASYCFP